MANMFETSDILASSNYGIFLEKPYLIRSANVNGAILMSETPRNTVKDTGAEPGDILVGISYSNNIGLLVEVLERQEKGKGGRVSGGFRILHPGTGRYAGGIFAVLEHKIGFRTAREFIEAVGSQPKCSDCTHILNRNSLWRLDLKAIRATFIS
jgi:hypothetical protein